MRNSWSRRDTLIEPVSDDKYAFYPLVIERLSFTWKIYLLLSVRQRFCLSPNPFILSVLHKFIVFFFLKCIRGGALVCTYVCMQFNLFIFVLLIFCYWEECSSARNLEGRRENCFSSPTILCKLKVPLNGSSYPSMKYEVTSPTVPVRACRPTVHHSLPCLPPRGPLSLEFSLWGSPAGEWRTDKWVGTEIILRIKVDGDLQQGMVKVVSHGQF